MAKRWMLMAIVLLTFAGASAQKNKLSTGLSFGHRTHDSLRVSALNMGLISSSDSLKGLQLSMISNMAGHAAGLTYRM